MKKILLRCFYILCTFLFFVLIFPQYTKAASGEVRISGTYKPGNTLTAKLYIDGVEYTGSASYQWQFDGGFITINMERYKQSYYLIYDSDVGHTIACIITANGSSYISKETLISDGTSGGSTETKPAPVLTGEVVSNGVKLTWNDSAQKNYTLKRKEIGTIKTMTIASNYTSTSYLDTGVEAGCSYLYTLQAHNNSGGYSETTFTITYGGSSSTPTPTPTPVAPTVGSLWNQDNKHVGDSVEYWGSASGGTGTLTYIWQKSTDNTNWSTISTSDASNPNHLVFTATETVYIRLTVKDQAGQTGVGGSGKVTVIPEEKVDYSSATESTPGIGLDIYIDNTLGLNYFAFFSQSEINEGRVLTVQIGNSTKTCYPLSQLKAYKSTSNGAFYRVTAPLAAKQMTEQVTFAVEYSGGGTISSQVYSVQNYAKTILSDSSFSNYYSVIKAMLNYGAAAQTYFEYNTGNLANSILSSSDKTLNTVGTIGARETTTSTSGTFNGLTYEGASLVLNDKTELRLYFASNPNVSSAYSATVISSSGASYTGTIKQKGSYYYVAIPDITRNDLRSTFTVSVKQQNTSGTMTVIYQPLYYIETTLKESTDASLKNLMTAFYWFIQS